MAAYPQLRDWLLEQMRREAWLPADLARAVKRHPGTVGRWVKGESRPDAESCDVLAEVFHVDQDVVLTLAGYRVDVDEIPVDDPRRKLHAMVDQVAWNPDLVAFMEGALERMLAVQRQ